MKKRCLWYSLGLIALMVVLCVFAYPMTTTLTVYTNTQKMKLLSEIQRPLETLAIEQARIVDPNYSWIQFQDQLSPEIENAVRENALSSQTNMNTNLSSDTNLAWSLSYNGKTVNHFWNDDYNSTEGVLDITFTSNGESVSFRNNGPGVLESQFTLFNKDNRTVINPALVTQDGESNEFVYYLVLPRDFSIRFYIPDKLHANGGLIAQCAARMDENSITFCLCMGLMILAVYILLWNRHIEAESFFFRRFIRLKALWAWLFLVAGTALATFGVYSVTSLLASGELRENLYALGMRLSQPNLFLPVMWIALWMAAYVMYSLMMMYVKYIFCFGFGRYLREDTLTSVVLASSQNRLGDVVRSPLETWTWARLLPFMTGICLFTFVSLFVSWLIFSWPGLVIALLADMGVLLLLARRMYLIVHQDYVTTLAAASELAEGNFSQIRPRQVGGFQKLYDSLVNIRDGFQTALKDGLASQNMKTQLISNVSHDLKTPVTGIKSYAELISMADSVDQVKEYSRRLINYTDRLNSLITDLFDVARANSGDIQLNKVSLNLSELILQVEGEWADTLGKSDLQMVIDVPEQAMTLLDADKTMRIIDNLMGNISKYAMPGTRVFITLQEIPGEYVLVVKNISKTPLDFKPDEITERFVRGDKSRHEPGSGLGLAIVKSFMEVQGGSFTIEIDGDVFKAILVFPKSVQETPAAAVISPAPAVPGSQESAAMEELLGGLPNTIIGAPSSAPAEIHGGSAAALQMKPAETRPEAAAEKQGSRHS